MKISRVFASPNGLALLLLIIDDSPDSEKDLLPLNVRPTLVQFSQSVVMGCCEPFPSHTMNFLSFC